MTTSHTPGPWIVRADPFPPNDANGQPMTGLEAVFHTIGKDTLMAIAEHVSPADARLIAAAPEMLAALQRFAAHWSQHSDPNTQGIACDAFQAIAKATGGTER